MLLYREKLLSNGQLKRLSEHAYNCENIGLLDKYLQPFWNFLTSKTPLWLAPNVITVSGLLVNIITTLVLVWHSPDARAEAPRWACLLCAVGLFVYQSLDAIDGKQARRTGTSNPLGELFDHGCDSLSTVFVALSACIAVQLGQYPTWMFFQCFCAMTLFYCAHWQTYVSGTMRFGRVDVTEAQCTIILIHLISAIFGPSIWMTEIPFLPGWKYFQLVVYLVTLGFLTSFCFFWRNFEEGGAGKNGSTVAGTSVLSPVIPFSLVIVPAYIIYKKSDNQLYENNPALYILAFGMVSAKVTNRLVVAHMTKNELDYLDTALVGPAMLFLNQYFNFFFKEYHVLWACLIWVTLDLLRYSIEICHEICDHLKIELFRIPYPNIGVTGKSNPSNRSPSNGQHPLQQQSEEEEQLIRFEDSRKSGRIHRGGLRDEDLEFDSLEDDL